MRRAALILLLVPLAAAQPSVSFATPGQYAGDLDVEGAMWALLYFRDADASFSFGVDDAQHINHSRVIGEATVQTGGSPSKTVIPGRGQTEEGGAWPRLDGSVRFSRGWASLYVEAAHINASVLGGRGYIQAAGGNIPEAYAPSHEPPPFTSRYDRVVPEGGVAFSVEGPTPRAAVSLELAAWGVTRMEWSNATTACSQSTCPDGARLVQTRATAPGGHGALVKRFHFAEVQTRDGYLAGAGDVLGGAVGGPGTDAVVAGSVRLPQADVRDCACPNPNGSTLITSGRIVFSDMGSADGRIQTSLGGDLDAMRFDEVPVEPYLFDARTAAVAAGAVVAGVALLKLLAWLFTRISGEDVLGHPVRRRIHEYLGDHPGSTRKTVLEVLELSNGGLSHHLKIMTDHDCVVSRRFLGHTYLFLREDLPGDWQQWLLRRHQSHAWLVEAVAARPGVSQTQLARRAERRDVSRGALQRRLECLVKHGVLVQRGDGRFVRYEPA